MARQLELHMLSGNKPAAETAAAWFADHSYFKSHGRNVTREDARALGIVVTDLEANGTLQDLVLSVSHAAQLTFGATPCSKLIENHHGRCWLVMESQQIIFGQAPTGPQPPPVPPAQS